MSCPIKLRLGYNYHFHRTPSRGEALGAAIVILSNNVPFLVNQVDGNQYVGTEGLDSPPVKAQSYCISRSLIRIAFEYCPRAKGCARKVFPSRSRRH